MLARTPLDETSPLSDREPTMVRRNTFRPLLHFLALGLFASLASWPVTAAPAFPEAGAPRQELAQTPLALPDEDFSSLGEPGYDQRSIVEEASDFLGEASACLGSAIEKAFRDHGHPDGYIKGQEVSAALTLGLRYGDGGLSIRGREVGRVHWQGPSFGWDGGLSASKVFILIYNLRNPNGLFRRFPGMEGGFYYGPGMSMTYLQADDIVIVPIRMGLGVKSGANIGYLHFTRIASWNPF